MDKLPLVGGSTLTLNNERPEAVLLRFEEDRLYVHREFGDDFRIPVSQAHCLVDDGHIKYEWHTQRAILDFTGDVSQLRDQGSLRRAVASFLGPQDGRDARPSRPFAPEMGVTFSDWEQVEKRGFAAAFTQARRNAEKFQDRSEGVSFGVQFAIGVVLYGLVGWICNVVVVGVLFAVILTMTELVSTQGMGPYVAWLIGLWVPASYVLSWFVRGGLRMANRLARRARGVSAYTLRNPPGWEPPKLVAVGLHIWLVSVAFLVAATRIADAEWPKNIALWLNLLSIGSFVWPTVNASRYYRAGGSAVEQEKWRWTNPYLTVSGLGFGLAYVLLIFVFGFPRPI